jgi:hypothetical protein
MGESCCKPAPNSNADLEFVASSVDANNLNSFDFTDYTTVGDFNIKSEPWIYRTRSDNIKLTIDG